MGIKEVGVMVEWSTAGDDRVCEECESMEGKIMDIDDAHGMIPVHPNCRCAFIPYIPEN
jgi:SPP1 gp7 family putative phage head morphogenesis protein